MMKILCNRERSIVKSRSSRLDEVVFLYKINTCTLRSGCNYGYGIKVVRKNVVMRNVAHGLRIY